MAVLFRLLFIVNTVLFNIVLSNEETPHPWPISCPCPSSGSSGSSSSSSSSSSSNDDPLNEPAPTCELFPIIIATGGSNAQVDDAFPLLIDSNNKNSIWRSLNAVEECARSGEFNINRGAVGLSANPDSTGKVTNDAMIMYGPTHDGASVAFLDNLLSAVSGARGVMHYTRHTTIVGNGAEKFTLSTNLVSRINTTVGRAINQNNNWKNNNCQTNAWRNFNDSTQGCPDPITGSYFEPLPLNIIEETVKEQVKLNVNNPDLIMGCSQDDWGLKCDYNQDDESDDSSEYEYDPDTDFCDHDTIGVIAIDEYGYMSVSESTNGLRNKIRGRVADSPIIGSGAYVSQGIGGCVGTGNGDVMQRFSPSKYAVELMGLGINVQEAAERSIAQIATFYNNTGFTIICSDACGNIGCGSYARNRQGLCSATVRNTGKTQNFTVVQQYRVPRVFKFQNQTWTQKYPKLKAVLA